MIVVVMGVAGSGKTTVGRMLASSLHLPFLDADDFHSARSLEAMERGVPLSDEERWPWLDRLNAELARESALPFHGVVLACSALTPAHRSRLSAGLEDLRWVLLSGDPALIRARIERRRGGVPADLLASQIDLLDPPVDAITVDVTEGPDQVMHRILEQLA